MFGPAAGERDLSMIPRIDDRWTGCRVRLGLSEDAATIAPWKSDDAAVIAALSSSVATLREGRLEPNTIYVVTEDSVKGPIVIGVVAIGSSSPYLQFVYIDRARRNANTGTRAAIVVIAHFFDKRTEPWLGVSPPVTNAGVRLLRRLGFASRGSQGWRLTRAAWTTNLASAASLFR